jgi:hypothetical protein
LHCGRCHRIALRVSPSSQALILICNQLIFCHIDEEACLDLLGDTVWAKVQKSLGLLLGVGGVMLYAMHTMKVCAAQPVERVRRRSRRRKCSKAKVGAGSIQGRCSFRNLDAIPEVSSDDSSLQ